MNFILSLMWLNGQQINHKIYQKHSNMIGLPMITYEQLSRRKKNHNLNFKFGYFTYLYRIVLQSKNGDDH